MISSWTPAIIAVLRPFLYVGTLVLGMLAGLTPLQAILLGTGVYAGLRYWSLRGVQTSTTPVHRQLPYPND